MQRQRGTKYQTNSSSVLDVDAAITNIIIKCPYGRGSDGVIYVASFPFEQHILLYGGLYNTNVAAFRECGLPPMQGWLVLLITGIVNDTPQIPHDARETTSAESAMHDSQILRVLILFSHALLGATHEHVLVIINL